MPEIDDPFAASQAAAQGGKDMLVEAIRGMKTRTVRPALAIKVSDKDYLADYAVWTGDAVGFQATLSELSARYKLEPGQIPRRAVMRIQDSERLKRRTAKKSQEEAEDGA